jgi:hypothetical protein
MANTGMIQAASNSVTQSIFFKVFIIDGLKSLKTGRATPS